MSSKAGWKMKRFWKEAGYSPADGGFAIRLDERPVKTPAKAPLVVPTEALARAICDEWQAQGEDIDPHAMPCTRSANAAIDKVMPNRAAVVGMLADYADTDLTCYRADGPQELRFRQDAAWDPLLDWAASRHGARLAPRTGIVYAPQEEAAIERLRAAVEALGPWPLTALHDLVTLSGSLIIGLAALDRHLPPEELWKRARLDEDWQAEQWGEDEIAQRESEAKRKDFLHAVRFHELLASP